MLQLAQRQPASQISDLATHKYSSVLPACLLVGSNQKKKKKKNKRKQAENLTAGILYNCRQDGRRKRKRILCCTRMEKPEQRQRRWAQEGGVTSYDVLRGGKEARGGWSQGITTHTHTQGESVSVVPVRRSLSHLPPSLCVLTRIRLLSGSHKKHIKNEHPYLLLLPPLADRNGRSAR